MLGGILLILVGVVVGGLYSLGEDIVGTLTKAPACDILALTRTKSPWSHYYRRK